MRYERYELVFEAVEFEQPSILLGELLAGLLGERQLSLTVCRLALALGDVDDLPD